MKVLYGIQGTGNGHIARATEIIPHLESKFSVDVLLSGYHSELEPPFEITYKMKGLGFMFGKKGGIDFLKTFSHIDSFRLRKEIRELPVEKYDIIINDFEPVSAWAGYYKNIPVISLSHQSALLSEKIPQPKKVSRFSNFILRNYAPSPRRFGFHFRNYEDWIFTPVIRSEVRALKPTNNGHITVYLPSYGIESLVNIFNQFPDYSFHVFDKHSSGNKVEGNVQIFTVDNAGFLTSFAECSGVICGAGFETPAEALFLGKSLLVIPMKNQFEQHFNAASLESLGVKVLSELSVKTIHQLKTWFEDHKVIQINFPDKTREIVNKVVEEAHGFDSP